VSAATVRGITKLGGLTLAEELSSRHFVVISNIVHLTSV
jgi:hypothetical protein